MSVAVQTTISKKEEKTYESASSSLKSTKSEEHYEDAYSKPASETGSASQKRVVYAAPISYNQQHQSSSSRVQKIITEVDEYNALFGEDAAQFILETRERERRELHDLNDRLAAYLERMRLLELQNKDLDAIKVRWQQDVANVKAAYERELDETQKDLDETGRTRAQLETHINRLQSELNELRNRFDDVIRQRDDNRNKIDALLQELDERENEANVLKRRVQALEDEIVRLRNENGRLQNELQKMKADLDREIAKGIEYQDQIQALLKKIEFMRLQYEQEVSELRQREVTVINADQYKSDLANAIRDIRREFDTLSDQNKQDMESWYVRRVQEIQVTESNQYREESKRLMADLDATRNKVADLEALNARLKREIQELETLLQTEKYEYESSLAVSETHIRKVLDENRNLQEKLKALLETNQNLYAEIAIYRKLLDNEEIYMANRQGGKGPQAQLPNMDEVYYGSQKGGRGAGGIIYEDATRGSRPYKGQQKSTYVSKQESLAQSKSNVQRASKGNVQFSDVPPDGRYITLENISISKDESLSEWKIVRLIDNKRELVFTFPAKFVIKAGKSVRVWAKNQGGTNNFIDSFIYEGESNWGLGANVITLLYNREGEERASFLQTTTTSQVSTI